jgi:catechol 2,3-dioxygenase-like lactoylglutathione lyase family enzyme
MKRLTAASLITAVALLLGSWVGAKGKPTRPKILGIVGLHFYTSDLAGARRFYSHILGKDLECRMCEEGALKPIGVRLPSEQYLEFAPAPNGTTNFLAAIDLATPDLKALDRYLKSQKIKTEGPGNYQLPAGAALTVKDPEGHQIRFVEVESWPSSNTDALRIIHAGFIVNDRAAADHFYKDILGFHLYWHGGMKEDVDQWVAMQVPDGTDWFEYMLRIPPDANKHTRGVMNHMALGVVDIHATQKQIIANGADPKEEPKVGRDGKWQLNLYDPDETRTEFMEFAPKEKPCCSEFNGTHPGPK